MNPKFLVVDLFCGAGGTTTGFEKARIGRRKIAKVIACVNHDTFAIQSHSSNHRTVLHFTEDIRTLDLGPLLRHVERMCRRYPNAKLVLWASLECTNFSRAKGGQRRDADSRTLAIQVYPTDSEMTRKIKEFMALYGIARITMRMLKVVELKRIMGLPDEYVLVGNQSKQKWMIGNMVHPVVPKAMAKALSRAIRTQEGRRAA